MCYDEQLIELRKNGVTIKEIAKILGRGERTVSRDLKRLGLVKKPDRTDISDEDVLKMWDDGLTMREISRSLSCNIDTVEKRLARNGITCSKKDGILRHFERTHGELWPEIKRRLDEGCSPTALAREYHMRYQNVFRLMEKNGYVCPSASMDGEVSGYGK